MFPGFSCVKSDQFQETSHSNLRFGDFHTPLRMLHRALERTDLQVPGAPLFSLPIDLPLKTEGEKKKAF